MATDAKAIAQYCERKIKSLINNDLKEICRHENLQVSGVKAALQKRITEGTNLRLARQPSLDPR